MIFTTPEDVVRYGMGIAFGFFALGILLIFGAQLLLGFVLWMRRMLG